MKEIDYLKSEYHNGRHWLLDPRSEKIVEYFQKYVPKDAKILELGCSSGRNLIHLHKAGYTNLSGLEMYPVKERSEFKLIRGRYEEVELEEYDVIFSASFLQDFGAFPQTEFDKTLQKCKKYFMIFGDFMTTHTHTGFEEIETSIIEEPFSQPIRIYARI